MNKPNISIIIPTCNEKMESYLLKMAMSYPKNADIEYIVVDSQTEPQILNSIGRDDFKIMPLDQSNRSQRLSYGFKHANGSFIIFHHPRSLLESDAFHFILNNFKTLSWGGFTHQFDQYNLGLKWTSWYSNKIRPAYSNIVYLDHCIYFQKTLMDQPIPPISIFEDSEISKILRRHKKPKILPFISKTSSIRFKTKGFIRQSLTNQILKLTYFMGYSDKAMNDYYEKDLNLNE